MVDASTLLEAVAGDQPAGVSLVNDPDVFLLEDDFGRLLDQSGSTADSSAVRDWDDIATRSADILLRSKHLQAAFYWASARLVCDGLDGLAAGLAFVRTLCDRYWDTLHPVPAGNDAVGLQRLAWINDLAHPGRYLRLLRERTLFVPEQGPAITFGDIAVAENLRAAPEGMTRRSSAEITQLFAETLKTDAEAAGAVARLKAAAADASGLAADIKRLTDNRASAQLDPLLRMIDAALRVLGGAAAEAASTVALENPAGGPLSAVASLPLTTGSPAGIESARASLKQIIAFFEKTEPSSPVPLILKRAERLIGKTFVECLQDLGGSLEQVNLVVSSPEPVDT